MTPPIDVHRIVHAIHVVSDIHAARRRYMDLLGAWAFAESHHPTEDRDMNLMYVANFMVEPMAPHSSNTSLGRYLERFGEGWQSIEFKVSDLGAARRALEAKGIRATLVYPSFFFAHPKDTFGMLLEVTMVEMPNDPMLYRGWNPSWALGHPSSLERLACITFAVREINGPRDMLRDVWGAEVVREDKPAGEEPLERCFLFLAGATLCLARPVGSGGPVASYIGGRGPGLYSLVWKVERLDAARTYFERKGVPVVEKGSVAGTFSIDPAATFGARHEFTERDLSHGE